MHRSAYVSLILFAAIAASWFALAQKPTSAQVANQPHLSTWEYHELEMSGGGFDRAAANKLGDNGWELVATFTPRNRDTLSIMIFKRKKLDR